jgi:hypothetical protein
MGYAAVTRNVVATGAGSVGREEAGGGTPIGLSVLVPCDRWYPCSGGYDRASLPLVVLRTDREQPEHGLTDCTVTTRICSGCATEHVSDPMALHSLIEQKNSDASARGDGPSHAERLIRVGSV